MDASRETSVSILACSVFDAVCDRLGKDFTHACRFFFDGPATPLGARTDSVSPQRDGPRIKDGGAMIHAAAFVTSHWAEPSDPAAAL